MCVLDKPISVMDFLSMSERTLKTCSREKPWRICAIVALHTSMFSQVIEAVAHAWNGQDELRSLRCGFDFLAQLRYIDVQAMRSGVRLLSPHFFQKHLSCKNLAPVDDEDFEQVKLGGGQRDFLPVEYDLPSRKIDAERTVLKAWFGSTGWPHGAAQGDPHARQHFFNAKGLGDVVIGPQVERFDLVAFGILHRKHDNWHVRRGSHLAAYLQAAHAWQQQVEQDKVRAQRGRGINCFLTTTCGVNAVTMCFEGAMQGSYNFSLIIDH